MATVSFTVLQERYAAIRAVTARRAEVAHRLGLDPATLMNVHADHYELVADLLGRAGPCDVTDESWSATVLGTFRALNGKGALGCPDAEFVFFVLSGYVRLATVAGTIFSFPRAMTALLNKNPTAVTARISALNELLDGLAAKGLVPEKKELLVAARAAMDAAEKEAELFYPDLVVPKPKVARKPKKEVPEADAEAKEVPPPTEAALASVSAAAAASSGRKRAAAAASSSSDFERPAAKRAAVSDSDGVPVPRVPSRGPCAEGLAAARHARQSASPPVARLPTPEPRVASEEDDDGSASTKTYDSECERCHAFGTEHCASHGLVAAQ